VALLVPRGLDKMTSRSSFQPQPLCDSEGAELTIRFPTEHWIVLRFKCEGGCVRWSITAMDHQLPVFSRITYELFNVDRANYATSV